MHGSGDVPSDRPHATSINATYNPRSYIHHRRECNISNINDNKTFVARDKERRFWYLFVAVFRILLNANAPPGRNPRVSWNHRGAQRAHNIVTA